MKKISKEDIKYRQGRTKEHWESNEITTMIAFCGLVIVLLYVIISNLF